ncbi:MAG: hypothetical protein PWP04_1051 [Candidatus Atribacteria bacterium]|nr:hypothetical protein [Candidatus Atribacteria bacterium]
MAKESVTLSGRRLVSKSDRSGILIDSSAPAEHQMTMKTEFSPSKRGEKPFWMPDY